MKHIRKFGLTMAVVAQAALLVACGGGSSDSAAPGPDDNTNPPAATPVTFSGQVAVDGAVRNTLVCLDLNTNSQCDGGEPSSNRTGADGAYSLTVSATEAASGAPLIAPLVPPSSATDTNGARDASNSDWEWLERPIVLRRADLQGGAINPLTTLVAAGVKAGLSNEQARTNVALQLGIDKAKIDGYQADVSPGAAADGTYVDNARLMAVAVAVTLEGGSELVVGDPRDTVAAALGDLVSLNYTDAANHSIRYFQLGAKPAGNVRGEITDTRSGRTAGTATDPINHYTQAYLTPQGWTRCDASVPVTYALGTPARATFCNALDSLSVRTNESIVGRRMADVVVGMQNEDGNSINAGQSNTSLVAALGNASFGAGSALRRGITVNLNQPVYIANVSTDFRPQAEATTLEQLVASRPTSGVRLPQGGGTLSLGLGAATNKNLRVAFGPTGQAVQFYQCDLSADQVQISNCTSTETGTYRIETIHGVRVMRFSGNAPTVMNHEQLYAEVLAGQQTNAVAGSGNWIYRARINKPYLEDNINVFASTRLNGSAWAEMKAQLGL